MRQGAVSTLKPPPQPLLLSCCATLLGLNFLICEMEIVIELPMASPARQKWQGCRRVWRVCLLVSLWPSLHHYCKSPRLWQRCKPGRSKWWHKALGSQIAYHRGSGSRWRLSRWHFAIRWLWRSYFLPQGHSCLLWKLGMIIVPHCTVGRIEWQSTEST